MRLFQHRVTRPAFLVLALATLIAGDAWRYTIGWTGWAILVGIIGAICIAQLVVLRGTWKLWRLPLALLAFLALAAVSTAWSFYPAFTAIGALSTWVTVAGAVTFAIVYSWDEILSALGMALRIVLGLSLLFEFIVAAFVRAPVLPPVAQPGVDYANLPDKIPPMFYWSRDDLFHVFDGARIQGILGNATLLSFAALIGIVIFGIQLADRRVRRSHGLAWLAVAVACFVFSRSATNILGLVAVIAVVVAVMFVRRASSPRSTIVTYGVIIVAVVGSIAASLLLRSQLLGLLGKSSDLTNRTEIWRAVTDLAQQRPVQGWGWVSYWVPWVQPFTDLAKNNGVRQLHAHNAWLDMWFQLGILGVLVFGVLVATTFWRTWSHAVDAPQFGPTDIRPFTISSMWPLLVLVALLVQSLAESRLLLEFGMLMLTLLAVKTTQPHTVPAAPPSVRDAVG